MGLGKTVQALALIVARPSTSPIRKTTLIVAPLALLHQWQKEIASKIKPQHKLDTMIFHASQTDVKHITLSELMDYDVILCTYGRLRTEYKILSDVSKDASKLKILHPRAVFHRVILDEAHNIKNKDAIVSQAAAALKTCYRLCMTGTPFMNCATEIYPLIRFLDIGPYNDWTKFSEDIDRPIARWDSEGDVGATGMRRLRELLHKNMLRRTKNSSIDGKPILKLPPRHDLIAYAEFDVEQAQYYYALERQQQLRFNKYLKAGTVMKHYAEILVLLLRLRQACNHPHLIKDHGPIEGARLDDGDMRDLAFNLDDETVARIKSLEVFECPMCHAKPDNPVHVHPCGHHICPECFTATVKMGYPEDGYDDDEELNHALCPHDGCRVQITSRNIFMHSFFVNAYVGAAETEADDEDIDAFENDGHDDNEPRAPPAFDGPADDRGVQDRVLESLEVDYQDIDDSEIDDEAAEEHEADHREYDQRILNNVSRDSYDDTGLELFLPQEDPKLDDRDMFDADHPEDLADEDAADEPMQEDEYDNNGRVRRGAFTGDEDFIKQETQDNPPAPIPRNVQSGTAYNPIVLEDDDEEDVHTSDPYKAIRDQQYNAFDDVVAPRRTKDKRRRKQTRERNKKPSSEHSKQRSRQPVDLTRSHRNDADYDDDSSPSKRHRAGNEDDALDIDHERFSDSLSLNRNHQGDFDLESVHHSEIDSESDERKPFLSLAGMRSGATNVQTQQRYHERLRMDWVSSAKIDKIVSLLTDIRDRQHKEKTLVFSLWPSFLDLLEVAIEMQGFTHNRYDGTMTPDARYKAVQDFQEDPLVEVMLVSLTAGNAGLNLTAATQVIIVEPFWNPYVEEQAIDRAHRIGQKRDVTVHRVLIRGTIEDRILRLQEKKKNLVNAALGENGGNAAGRLTVGELEGLFGV